MYEQRSPIPADRFAVTPRLWEPEKPSGIRGEAESPPMRDMDLYVVVEAIAEGRIAFDVAPWPNLDVQGRLRFEKKPRFTRSFLYADAQYVFDRAREDLGLLTRPLRVGDAFRVRDAGEDLTEWEILDDVTHAARRAAKMALYAAVAPRLNEEEAQGRALGGREVREPDRPEDASGDSVAFPVI